MGHMGWCDLIEKVQKYYIFILKYNQIKDVKSFCYRENSFYCATILQLTPTDVC